MKRYYVSKIIGTGAFGDAYRTKISDYGVNHSEEVPTDANGVPTSTWSLVIVNTVNHGPLLADPDLDVLPDFPMDAKMAAMHANTRSGMEQKLQARGINTTFLATVDGYRDVIRGLGRKLNPDFSENNFDVSG